MTPTTRIALYTGSFDPLTLGHLDVIRAAAALCDRLIVAIGVHPTKTPLLDAETRSTLIREETSDLGRHLGCEIVVDRFDGLAVDAARRFCATTIVRGLRNGSDLDGEMAMAGMNHALAPDILTVFVPASPETRHITATLVRQVALLGGDISAFVPPGVAAALRKTGQGA